MDRKKSRKKRSPGAHALLRELREYEREGTQLYLDGRPSRAGEIADACAVAEDSAYMRDFISDDSSHITQIRFTRISGRTS